MALVVDDRRLALVDLNSLRVSSIVDVGTSGYVAFPTWAPDGQELAYMLSPGPDSIDVPPDRIEIVSIAGGPPRKLTSGAAPSWSPDGRWIAFNKTGGDVWLIRPDGSAPHLLAARGHEPTWAPDSKSVVFTESGPDGTFIASVSIDDPRSAMAIAPGQQAALSPNGTRIAFIRPIQQVLGGLWVGPADSPNRARQLIQQPIDGLGWFPDGEHLVVSIPIFEEGAEASIGASGGG